MEPSFDEVCKLLREKLNEAEEDAVLIIAFAKSTTYLPCPASNLGEMIANVTIAFRHIEDARMRLGKAIQAADGGISVYPR